MFFLYIFLIYTYGRVITPVNIGISISPVKLSKFFGRVEYSSDRIRNPCKIEYFALIMTEAK